MSDQYPPQNPYGQQPGGPQYGGPPQGGQPPFGGPQQGGQQPYGQPSSGGEPPLWAPWYGISFPKALARFFKKYVAFSGRASRSEFWWVVLWSVIISIVISLVGGAIDGAADTPQDQFGTGTIENTLSGLWGLATLLPSVAIQMRRLHDANFSGWLWLLVFIPVLGWIALIVLSTMQSNPAGQRFDRPEATR